MKVQDLNDSDMRQIATTVRILLEKEFGLDRVRHFLTSDPEFVERFLKVTWIALRNQLESKGA